MSYDRLIISRKVYRINDWANYVGGIFGFIQLLGKLLLPLISGWSLEKHLITKLFKGSEEVRANNQKIITQNQ